MTTTTINPIDLCKAYANTIVDLLQKHTSDEVTDDYLVSVQEDFNNYLDNMKLKLGDLVKNADTIQEWEFDNCFKDIFVKQNNCLDQAHNQGMEISRNIRRENANLQIIQLVCSL